VHAATLASRGLQGPREAFEGRFGAFAMYEATDAAQVVQDLGKRWENTGIGFKKYPNCGCAHAPLQAALDLVRTHRLTTEDVDGIRVVLTPYAHRLVGAPYAPTEQPEVSAQFSVQYALAVALLRGRFDLDDITPARALDPQALALAGRVQVDIDASQTGRMGPATVEFSAQGRVHRATVQHLPGGPESPLRLDEVVAKARDGFTRGAHALTPPQADRLIDRVLRLGALADVNALWD
jgi:2-methylcitrate dehydratase PrpD